MFVDININNTVKYNIIKQNLYNETNPNNKIRYKFVPLQYRNIILLATSLNELEGLFSEKNIDKIDITLTIEEKTKKIYLKKIICFFDEEYDPVEYYDCYIDTFLNLLFIRLDDKFNINYYNLDDYDYLNYYLLEYNKIDCGTDLNKITVLENYYWAKRFLVFPELPFLLSVENNSNTECGTKVINKTDNKLIGIVNFTILNNNNNYDYFITPIFSILFSLKMLFEKKYILFNLDYKIEKITTNTSITDNYNCLKINETYFNTYNTSDINGNIIEINNKIFDKNISISALDNMLFDENGMITYYKPIPIKSYIWFFKNIDEDNFLNMKYDKLKIINNKILKEKKETKIYNNTSIGINLSNFNYINYKNKYIFELNENLLLILKKYLVQDKLYHELITHIVKNRFKKDKIILGIEFYSSLKLDKYNKDNIQINITNDLIQIRPRIFIIKKYRNIQEIYNKYSTKDKLTSFMKIIFQKV
jgi:hypothetical protein